MLILAELEPFRHLSRVEVSELFDKRLVSETDLRIKLNFPNFVRRFERENFMVLSFSLNSLGILILGSGGRVILLCFFLQVAVLFLRFSFIFHLFPDVPNSSLSVLLNKGWRGWLGTKLMNGAC